MTQTQEAPHRAVLDLLTGHFHETSGYRALRLNGVADWLLTATLSGSGRFGHADGELITQPGDWVLLRPGTRHDYGVEATQQRWELLWVHFQPRPDWLDWLAWPSVAPGLMRLHVDPGPHAELARQFAQVHHLRNGGAPRRIDRAMNALEALLLACDDQNAAQTTRSGEPRIHRAMDHIDRHLDARLSLDSVASVVGLSASRLSHLFKATTGQTVQAYIEARRLRRAADLLGRTSFPIQQIAASAGFDSPFYFAQRFKRWTGLTPTAFRQQQEPRSEAGISPPA